MGREGRARTRSWIASALALAFAAASWAAEPEADAPATRADLRAERDLQAVLARGRTLYRQACWTCHGSGGRGSGPSAKFLDPRPRDLSAGVFKFRSTYDLPTDADLARTIRAGVPGTAMPAFGEALSPGAIAAVVVYVKSLSPAFEDPARGEGPVVAEVSERRALTDASAVEHGGALYARMGCATCHGAGGRGDGVGAAGLFDHAGRPIAPRDFTAGVYKSGPTDADVFRAITTGLGGTPMVAYGPALSEAERWDLVAYLRSLADPSFLETLLCRAP